MVGILHGQTIVNLLIKGGRGTFKAGQTALKIGGGAYSAVQSAPPIFTAASGVVYI